MSRLSAPLTDRAVRQASGSVMKTMNTPRMELYDMPGKENLHRRASARALPATGAGAAAARAHLRWSSQNLKGSRTICTRPPSRGTGKAGPAICLPFSLRLRCMASTLARSSGCLELQKGRAAHLDSWNLICSQTR